MDFDNSSRDRLVKDRGTLNQGVTELENRTEQGNGGGGQGQFAGAGNQCNWRLNFRALCETVPDCLCIFDEDGSILEVNTKMAAVSGFAPPDLREKKVWHLYLPEDEERLKAAWAECGQTGTDLLPATLVTRYGKRINMEVRIIPLSQDNRKAYLSISRDLTSHLRLEQRLIEALALNRTIVRTSSLGILAYKSSGQCIFANDNAVRIIGGTREELLRQNFYQIRPWEESGLLNTAKKALDSNREERQEVHVVSTFGKEIWLDCRFITFSSQQEPHLLLLIDDISSRKKAEAFLEESRGELEREVAQRTSALSRANAELEAEIIERRQAEASLRQSETRFRELAENIREAFWIFDWPGKKLLYASPVYEEVWGRPLNHLLQDSQAWAQSVHPDDLAYARESFRKIVQRGGGEPREYRIVRPDNTIRWISDRGFAVYGPNGAVERIVGIAEDITHRKKAEEALKASEEQYRLLVRSIPAVVFKGYQDWSVDFFDHKIEELTGYPKADFDCRRLKWCDVVLPEDLPTLKKAAKEALETSGSYVREYRIRNNKGEVRWLQARGTIIQDAQGKIDYISGVFFDITPQKEMQEALRITTERLQFLLSATPAVIYSCEAEEDYWVTFISGNVLQLLGYAAGEFLNDSKFWENCVHPEDLPLARQWLPAVLEQGFHSLDYRFRHKDGHYLWMRNEARLVRREAGRPAEIVGFMIDITARKKAEDELRTYQGHLESLVAERTAALSQVNERLLEEIQEHHLARQALGDSEERFRRIFEESPIGIGLRDLEGYILEANPALLRIWGYSHEELRGKCVTELIHPEDEPRRAKLSQDLLEGRRGFFSDEFRFFHKDGSLRWCRVHSYLLHDENHRPRYSLGMLQDITRQKQVDEELAQYQENLRSLASELSLTEERERRRLAEFLHDEVSQALALAKIKLGGLQLALTPDPLRNQVNEVREVLEQAIQSTRNLTLELSLPILYETGLEKAVEWLAEQFQRQYGITIVVNHDALPKPLSEGARVLLFRLVRELLTNVVKHSQASRAEISFQRQGDYLNIRLQDNGIGFDAAQKTPFAADTGGFGLFSVRERLRHLGGFLEVHSIPGEGTKISIVVPLHQPQEFAPVW